MIADAVKQLIKMAEKDRVGAENEMFRGRKRGGDDAGNVHKGHARWSGEKLKRAPGKAHRKVNASRQRVERKYRKSKGARMGNEKKSVRIRAVRGGGTRRATLGEATNDRRK